MKITRTFGAAPCLNLVLAAASFILPPTISAQTGQATIDGNAVGTGSPAIFTPVSIPSGIIPPACKVLPPRQSVLDCFLNDPSESKIANQIVWGFPDGTAPIPWSQWPAWAKNDLRIAFANTVSWYNGGMVNYPGSLVADPPVNLNAGSLTAMVVDGATVAWPIFIGHVALNLAAEIYAWVPWSLHNYDNTAMYNQFNNGFWYSAASPAGYHLVVESTPANAIYTFKFLKTNNLIGATRIDTIARILDWTRKNLSHIGGAFNYQNYNYYFQYWGNPPVSRIIEGTMTTDPLAPYFWGVKRHWTAGCFGSTGFDFWVFKAASIPVWPVGTGYHQAPSFSGEHRYLSHGDDPYASYAKARYSADQLLIDEATYTAWFPAANPDAGDLNVGRRVIELAVTHPDSQALLDMYCDDVQKAKTHANGRVYNEVFKEFYPVPYLESMNLWQLLDQDVLKYGCSM